MENNIIFEESTNYKKIRKRKLYIKKYETNDIDSNVEIFKPIENNIFIEKNEPIEEKNIFIENDDEIDNNKKKDDNGSLEENKIEPTYENIFMNPNDFFEKIEKQVDNNLENINKEVKKENIDSSNNKVSKIPIILFSIVFIAGICLMFYPTICNLINNSKHHYIINGYDNRVENTSNKNIEDMLNKAYEYNKGLEHNSIQDVFSTDKVSNDSLYDSLLKITDDGLMGYITIPKINVKLPIYHTTNEEVLEKGVGHLKGSSLPVGGEGTNSILAAHRGLPSSKLFSDLDKLENGDKFYISILDKKLVYQVDKVSVVKPSELDLLEISPDKDYVTLVTCTPYGVNTHRLIVRGTRIEESEEVITNELEDKELIYLSTDDKILLGVVIGIFVLIIIILIRILVKKK